MNDLSKQRWRVQHSESKDAFNVVGINLGYKYKIARVPYLVTESIKEVNEREKKEAELHAQLISKAPELLQMLIEIDEKLKSGKVFQLNLWDKRITNLIKEANELTCQEM